MSTVESLLGVAANFAVIGGLCYWMLRKATKEDRKREMRRKKAELGYKD